MKASVIIPAFNAEKKIRQCIESLLSQSVKPFEIIAVNDESTDNTLEILEGFGKKIKVLSQKNSGPARARNNGAKKAKGKILVFTDSDCIAGKEFIKEITRPFERKEIIGVQGRYLTKQTALMALFDQCDIETRYEKMKKHEFIDFIGSYAAAYRKKDFFEAKGFDEKYKMASGEDTDLSFKLAGKGKKMVFAQNAVVYHAHPESILKYLRTKFYRGYWRVRLYSRHPEKKTKDSYTSKATLAGTFLAGLSIIFLAMAFIAFELQALQNIMPALFFASLVLMLVLEWRLIMKCFGKKIQLGFYCLPLIVLRNFAQCFGIILGVLKSEKN